MFEESTKHVHIGSHPLSISSLNTAFNELDRAFDRDITSASTILSRRKNNLIVATRLFGGKDSLPTFMRKYDVNCEVVTDDDCLKISAALGLHENWMNEEREIFCEETLYFHRSEQITALMLSNSVALQNEFVKFLKITIHEDIYTCYNFLFNAIESDVLSYYLRKLEAFCGLKNGHFDSASNIQCDISIEDLMSNHSNSQH